MQTVGVCIAPTDTARATTGRDMAGECATADRCSAGHSRGLRERGTQGRQAHRRVERSLWSVCNSPRGNREHTAAIRAWAREAGRQVSDRGRISAEVVKAFEEAHRGLAAVG
jgi:hypothetical protein